MNLKELYDRIGSDEGWHKSFKTIVEEVKERIAKLSEKPFDINDEIDRKFLWRILVKEIGVANITRAFGQTGGGGQQGFFDRVIKDDKFINSLPNYMQNPNDEKYFDELLNARPKSEHSIMKRFAATCTQNVSTLVSDDFETVVEYLVEEGIIQQDDVPKGTWFKMNQDLMKIIDKELGDSADEYQKSMFVKGILDYKNKKDKLKENPKNGEYMQETEQSKSIEKCVDLLKAKKNLILTGAPGTGKTYNTAEIALRILGKTDLDFSNRKAVMEAYNKAVKDSFIAFTTFHQSMDYEEFVEGLKPDIDKDTKQIIYNVKPGIFKKICEQAKEVDFGVAWDKMVQAIKKAEDTKEEYKMENFDTPVTINSKGNPTFAMHHNPVAKKEHVEILYTSGKTELEVERYLKITLNHLREKFYLKEYKKEDFKNHVLIIDEINRGNISKIFGELITLLEKDKRLGEENVIEVTLPYSQKKFGVPSNLYIIGTMNTADRSIGHIDYAIRRRFAFHSMKSDINVIDKHKDSDDATKSKAKKLFETIKKFIEAKDNINIDLDVEDLMIGHSYFLCKNLSELKEKLEYEIIPLVKEYHKDGILTVDKEQLETAFTNWNELLL